MTNGEGTPPPPPPGGTGPPQGGMAPPPPAATPAPPAAAGAKVDSQGRPLAEWWKRAVAAIIDAVILGIVNAIFGAIFGGFGAATGPTVDPTTGQITGGQGFFVGLILGNLLLLAIGVLYYVILNGNERGQTVGKMVMKIQVRAEATGGPAGYGKALIRYIVGAVLFIACVVPGIIDILFPLWDEKRQALHDKAAGTLVIDLG